MCGDSKFFGRAALSRTTILVAAAGPIAIIVDIVAGLWVAGDYQLRAAFGEEYSSHEFGERAWSPDEVRFFMRYLLSLLSSVLCL
jgi:hypothetical protein